VPEAAIDPITYEVIRHRLMAIVAQQSVVLKSVSGSPVVTDANDCNTGIYLPDGEIVVIGPHVIVHAGSMGLVVPHILEDCAENPGIGEGDTFVTSDPYKGALHMPDVTVLEPVFWEGERIAWVGACAHELDVGGMNHSSWCPTATEYQQEGLILPPTKLVEGGGLRQDVWNLILAASRLPDNVGLDLRAMLAANTHGKRGLLRLIERYGVETVTGVMRTMLDRTEQLLRERLRGMPDGRFRARSYLDHDGHANRLYTIDLELRKHDDVRLRVEQRAGSRLHQHDAGGSLGRGDGGRAAAALSRHTVERRRDPHPVDRGPRGPDREREAPGAVQLGHACRLVARREGRVRGGLANAQLQR